jgi:hypothetical protein
MNCQDMVLHVLTARPLESIDPRPSDGSPTAIANSHYQLLARGIRVRRRWMPEAKFSFSVLNVGQGSM